MLRRAWHRTVLTRRHSPHEMQVYLMCKSDSERLKNARRGDAMEEKTAMAEIFQGAGWQTDDILQSMKDADDFYCERQGPRQAGVLVSRPRGPCWGCRVLPIG